MLGIIAVVATGLGDGAAYLPGHWVDHLPGYGLGQAYAWPTPSQVVASSLDAGLQHTHGGGRRRHARCGDWVGGQLHFAATSSPHGGRFEPRQSARHWDRLHRGDLAGL